jgi:putative transposase
MNKDSTTAANAEDLFAGEAWFDPIEAGIRGRIRGFIEAMLEEELAVALGGGRYERGHGKGHRHGKRSRHLLGSFGPTTISVPRARLSKPDGTSQEWRSATLPRYARMTRQVEALIAASYLAGTNTRRVRRALGALFKGAVGKDVVSRTWRRVKVDWEGWNRRSLAEDDIVRLILDGTVVRVRLDRQASNISLLVVLGIRSDGQKVLLSVRNMGGESEAAWRGVLDDLLARGLRTPHFLIIDGAAGLERALAHGSDPALHGSQASQSAGARPGTAARGDHRRLYRHDLRRECERDRDAASRVPAQVAAEVPGRGRQSRGSWRSAVQLHPPAIEPMALGAHHQCDRTAA